MKAKLTRGIVLRPETVKGFDPLKGGIIWDDAQEGFGLRVTARKTRLAEGGAAVTVGGVKTYIVRYWLAGKGVQTRIGPARPEQGAKATKIAA